MSRRRPGQGAQPRAGRHAAACPARGGSAHAAAAMQPLALASRQCCLASCLASCPATLAARRSPPAARWPGMRLGGQRQQQARQAPPLHTRALRPAIRSRTLQDDDDQQRYRREAADGSCKKSGARAGLSAGAAPRTRAGAVLLQLLRACSSGREYLLDAPRSRPSRAGRSCCTPWPRERAHAARRHAHRPSSRRGSGTSRNPGFILSVLRACYGLPSLVHFIVQDRSCACSGVGAAASARYRRTNLRASLCGISAPRTPQLPAHAGCRAVVGARLVSGRCRSRSARDQHAKASDLFRASCLLGARRGEGQGAGARGPRCYTAAGQAARLWQRGRAARAIGAEMYN